MNLVKVILRPEKAHALKDILTGIGYHGITTKEIAGYGEQKQTIKQVYRGKVYEQVVDTVKRAELEFVAPDNKIEKVIKVIRDTVSTGQGGDGRIYVLPMKDAIHIGSGSTHSGDSSEEDLTDVETS
jgi:nitrogen regulatory protein P-II 1